MADTTETTGVAATNPSARPIPPAGAQANPSGVNVRLSQPHPDALSAGEAEASVFPSADAAEATVADLVAAGVPRESIVVLTGKDEKRRFLKRYLFRDNDRHTHAGTSAAYFALAGALVMGIFGALVASQFTAGTFWPIASTLLGAIIGAVVVGSLVAMSMRTADDSSVEFADSFANSDGTLVAVERPIGSGGVPLDEVGRILNRHNGRAVRLRRHMTQADLHPGDTRPDPVDEPLTHG